MLTELKYPSIMKVSFLVVLITWFMLQSAVFLHDENHHDSHLSPHDCTICLLGALDDNFDGPPKIILTYTSLILEASGFPATDKLPVYQTVYGIGARAPPLP